MKINIVFGSLVLGASLCGQSFGGDLLSRLLGGHGCGAKSSCCDTYVTEPSCGAEIASPCGSGYAAPSCGAEIAACDPCSSAPSCDSGFGGRKHCGLLAKIFSGKKKGCDAGACDSCASPVAAGCSSCGGTAISAPVASPMAAPAPVVDPHAYMNTKRHVIQASNTRIR